MDLLTAAGISVTRMDMPGRHAGFPVERIVALQEVLLRRRAQ
jgi:hypothetical protein